MSLPQTTNSKTNLYQETVLPKIDHDRPEIEMSMDLSVPQPDVLQAYQQVKPLELPKFDESMFPSEEMSCTDLGIFMDIQKEVDQSDTKLEYTEVSIPGS